jgi:hypothetical protein
MTPKEKAEQLLAKMNVIHYRKLFGKSKDSKGLPVSMYNSQIKQCALIAVDEIIQSRQDDGYFDDTLSSTGSEYYTPHPMYLTYWLQVKNEINKL